MELLGSPSRRNLSETQASRKQGGNHSATSCFSLLRGCKTPNWCCMALSALVLWGGRYSHGREFAHCLASTPVPHLHTWCFISDIMGMWWQHHHSSGWIKRKSMNQTRVIMLSQGFSCQKTNRSLVSFHRFPISKGRCIFFICPLWLWIIAVCAVWSNAVFQPSRSALLHCCTAS